MKHLTYYREGIITIDEMVSQELHDCQYDDNWLKDVLHNKLSEIEYSVAWETIDKIMRKKSLDRVLK